MYLQCAPVLGESRHRRRLAHERVRSRMQARTNTLAGRLIRRRRVPTAKLNRINYYAGSPPSSSPPSPALPRPHRRLLLLLLLPRPPSGLIRAEDGCPPAVNRRARAALRAQRFISDSEALQVFPQPRLQTGPLSPERDRIRTIVPPSHVPRDKTSASSERLPLCLGAGRARLPSPRTPPRVPGVPFPRGGSKSPAVPERAHDRRRCRRGGRRTPVHARPMGPTETESASNWKPTEIRSRCGIPAGRTETEAHGNRRGESERASGTEKEASAWDEEVYPAGRSRGVGVAGGGRGKGEIEEQEQRGRRNLRRFHAWRTEERARPGLLVARKAAASRLTAGAHYTGRSRERDRATAGASGAGGAEGTGTKKEVARAESRDGRGGRGERGPAGRRHTAGYPVKISAKKYTIEPRPG